LSDATGIVRNDLSTMTAGAESCQSRFFPLRLINQSFLQSFMPSFSTSVSGCQDEIPEIALIIGFSSLSFPNNLGTVVR
jgi:hypothetical protein